MTIIAQGEQAVVFALGGCPSDWPPFVGVAELARVWLRGDPAKVWRLRLLGLGIGCKRIFLSPQRNSGVKAGSGRAPKLRYKAIS
jgi:hypothetical protein